MEIQTVKDRLKEIGPHVLHYRLGDWHCFRVQETEFGPQEHVATLAISDHELRAFEFTDELMAEGRARYAKGLK